MSFKTEFFRAARFARHWWKSGSDKILPTAFLGRFLENAVYASDKKYGVFDDLEKLRDTLLADTSELSITDFGAGGINKSGRGKDGKFVSSKHQRTVIEANPIKRQVRDIASGHLASTRKAQLLFRIADYLHPEAVIELGTSLGLTTLYWSNSVSGPIISIEGCPQLSAFAKQLAENQGTKSIRFLTGDIKERLPEALAATPKNRIVYFDANHSYYPTIQYFKTCLKASDENTVFIFDDIYWSPGMEKAWCEIQSHPSCRCSLDLFHIGIVLLRPEAEKGTFAMKAPFWF